MYPNKHCTALNESLSANRELTQQRDAQWMLSDVAETVQERLSYNFLHKETGKLCYFVSAPCEAGSREQHQAGTELSLCLQESPVSSQSAVWPSHKLHNAIKSSDLNEPFTHHGTEVE